MVDRYGDLAGAVRLNRINLLRARIYVHPSYQVLVADVSIIGVDRGRFARRRRSLPLLGHFRNFLALFNGMQRQGEHIADRFEALRDLYGLQLPTALGALAFDKRDALLLHAHGHLEPVRHLDEILASGVHIDGEAFLFGDALVAAANALYLMFECHFEVAHIVLITRIRHFKMDLPQNIHHEPLHHRWILILRIHKVILE